MATDTKEFISHKDTKKKPLKKKAIYNHRGLLKYIEYRTLDRFLKVIDKQISQEIDKARAMLLFHAAML